jgi:hypothetical protein
MRVLRSRHGKAALEIGGNTVIQFLTITSNGPRFDRSERRAFFAEFNTVLDMPPEEGIFSFLRAAKRGYTHSKEVCNFLWEQLMSKNFSDMTHAELIACYNRIASSVNVKPRSSFTSKAEVIAAIEKLDALVKEPTQTQLQNQGKIMTQTVNEDGEVVAVEKKPRGKGVGARAMELILEGRTNEEVIETVRSEIEGANPTPATMAWYRNKLRKEGLLPPSTRKVKAAAEAEEPEAEAA